MKPKNVFRIGLISALCAKFTQRLGAVFAVALVGGTSAIADTIDLYDPRYTRGFLDDTLSFAVYVPPTMPIDSVDVTVNAPVEFNVGGSSQPPGWTFGATITLGKVGVLTNHFHWTVPANTSLGSPYDFSLTFPSFTLPYTTAFTISFDYNFLVPLTGEVIERFYVGSATLTANNHLTFSPGYVSVTYIPEPSTWTMMIFGFSGLGYSGWRRGAKRRIAAA
jgi:PEP-CTERM motif